MNYKSQYSLNFNFLCRSYEKKFWWVTCVSIVGDIEIWAGTRGVVPEGEVIEGGVIDGLLPLYVDRWLAESWAGIVQQLVPILWSWRKKQFLLHVGISHSNWKGIIICGRVNQAFSNAACTNIMWSWINIDTDT